MSERASTSTKKVAWYVPAGESMTLSSDLQHRLSSRGEGQQFAVGSTELDVLFTPSPNFKGSEWNDHLLETWSSPTRHHIDNAWRSVFDRALGFPYPGKPQSVGQQDVAAKLDILARALRPSILLSRTEEDEEQLRLRMVELRRLAEEEQDPVSQESENLLTSFVKLKQLPNPGVVLTPKGVFRAIWENDRFKLELDFLENNMISIVFSRRSDLGLIGRYVGTDNIEAIHARWSDVFGDLRASR